jgi:hypothetical protein
LIAKDLFFNKSVFLFAIFENNNHQVALILSLSVKFAIYQLVVIAISKFQADFIDETS